MNRGFLLIEILIAIALIAIITFVGFQMVMVGQRGGQIVADRDTANRLAEEAVEILRNLAVQDWGEFQGLEKSATGDSPTTFNHYLVFSVASGWSIESVNGGTGFEGIATADGRSYQRFFHLYDVSRDATTGDIESPYDEANRDFSTQKVKVFVRLAGQNEPLVTLTEYLTRWRNLVCAQGEWANEPGESQEEVKCDEESITTYKSMSDLTIENDGDGTYLQLSVPSF